MHKVLIYLSLTLTLIVAILGAGMLTWGCYPIVAVPDLPYAPPLSTGPLLTPLPAGGSLLVPPPPVAGKMF